MAAVVRHRRVVHSVVHVVDLLESSLHRLKLRLRVVELRRDPALRRELDQLAREDNIEPSPTADADLDRYIAELERQ